MASPLVMGVLPQRGFDEWGGGHFGAPRGNRRHEGVDYACYPGTKVCSPVAGKVTKHGHPYADALEYKYIQITTENKLHHRFFYVEPQLAVGASVLEGFVIGIVQNLLPRYPKITNHFHYEIMTESGRKIDPNKSFGDIAEGAPSNVSAQARVVRTPEAMQKYFKDHQKLHRKWQ